MVHGCARLGHRAQRDESRARIGFARKDSPAPVGGAQLSATKRRRRLPRGERPGQDSCRGAAANRDHVSVGTADLIDRLMAGESSPAGQFQGDGARRRSDLQNAAGRDTLEGRREQDLQAAAELEMLGVHPMGCLLAVDRHDNSACSRIAVCSDA